jgi:hypothetical protein
MIVTGGENVYSTEVEDVLYRHPAVLEAAVFAVPDDRWGEAVHAVVVLRSEATEADLRECGKCGWPMCKRCWDYNNGRCSHCEWIVPDLPAALTPFLHPFD